MATKQVNNMKPTLPKLLETNIYGDDGVRKYCVRTRPVKSEFFGRPGASLRNYTAWHTAVICCDQEGYLGDIISTAEVSIDQNPVHDHHRCVERYATC